MSILVSLCLLKIEIVQDMSEEAGKHQEQEMFKFFFV